MHAPSTLVPPPSRNPPSQNRPQGTRNRNVTVLEYPKSWFSTSSHHYFRPSKVISSLSIWPSSPTTSSSCFPSYLLQLSFSNCTCHHRISNHYPPTQYHQVEVHQLFHDVIHHSRQLVPVITFVISLSPNIISHPLDFHFLSALHNTWLSIVHHRTGASTLS